MKGEYAYKTKEVVGEPEPEIKTTVEKTVETKARGKEKVIYEHKDVSKGATLRFDYDKKKWTLTTETSKLYYSCADNAINARDVPWDDEYAMDGTKWESGSGEKYDTPLEFKGTNASLWLANGH